MVAEQFENVFRGIVIIWKHYLSNSGSACVPQEAGLQAESLCAIPLLERTILGGRGEGQVDWSLVKGKCFYPVLPAPVGQRCSHKVFNSPEFPGCIWGGTHNCRLVCISCNLCEWIQSMCTLMSVLFFVVPQHIMTRKASGPAGFKCCGEAPQRDRYWATRLFVPSLSMAEACDLLLT